jgi:hypothetical protein
VQLKKHGKIKYPTKRNYVAVLKKTKKTQIKKKQKRQQDNICLFSFNKFNKDNDLYSLNSTNHYKTKT